MTMNRICLVTSAHISYNPRLVKEADALQAAGYDVRVVAMNMEEAKWRLDCELMSRRRWKLEVCDTRKETFFGRYRWLVAAARQRFYLNACFARFAERLPQGVEKAFWRYTPELTRLAKRKKADLFIGHLAGLPAAGSAADRWNAKLGFDAEDFHRGEFAEDQLDGVSRRVTEVIEEKYISRCDYVTSASDGIGRAYSKVLQAPQPETILNVFPLSERSGHTPREELALERTGDELALYWYSQTIGSDRGLQDALRALALLRPRAHLTVRGTWAAGFEEKFWAKANELGVANQVRVLAPVPPDQLAERAARHDVGLALEPGNRLNNQLAVSNKLFVYLLAGLAVAASNTPGQAEILGRAQGVGFVYQPGDAGALAEGLRRWIEHPALLAKAKEEARLQSTACYCWEVESKKFLQVIRGVI